ncbi:MAG: bifunctional phosphoglucose/phosphomannose isomerase [Patescibacteria group bacterium]|nr:bifunctional phosphoglucose/phosphomannose isomerase [Patescibacteria group bacterium]MDD5534218.1 bifunctional phosphoglucose/phosphomannose isomerase [Patescibacteria group bacterium]
MTILDDLKQIRKIDKLKMADFISELPEQCLAAYEQALKISLPKDCHEVKNIIICGMGGSAIGGELAKDLVQNKITVPIIINRDFNLPILVDEKSLVILVSYSGNTQETINCFKQSLKTKAKKFVITGGGELEKMAKKENCPIFKFKYSAPPRASLAYLFIPILVIFEKMGLVNLKSWQITESLKELQKINKNFKPETLTEKNKAKFLAYSVFDRLPIIIAPSHFSSLANRLKNQLAENGKNFAFSETWPEIFHNFIESRLPLRMEDDLIYLFLDDLNQDKEIKKSLISFQDLLDKKRNYKETISPFGENYFTQFLSFILISDWLSFYLAILNQSDPTPVENINWLKKQL